MGSYERILTVAFLILSVIFVLCAIKACGRAIKEDGHKLRKKLFGKALFWMFFALMFFLCAMYIIFRVSWFMMLVFIMGTSVSAYTIGCGLAANMREH